MSNESNFDYGPLTDLVGTCKGDKGLDVAPEPDGVENNPYYETIIFEPIGDVTNAESQVLMVLQYRQVVCRKSTDKVFHDESGYWMWDSRSETIMHSFTIPRAVCVLAGGKHSGAKNEDGSVTLKVSANVDDAQWGIIQSPFMQDNARTTAFRHHITVGNGRLSYSETTIVDIYGKVFEHTDDNELLLQ